MAPFETHATFAGASTDRGADCPPEQFYGPFSDATPPGNDYGYDLAFPSEPTTGWGIPAFDLLVNPAPGASAGASTALPEAKLQTGPYNAEDIFSALDGSSLFLPGASNPASSDWIDFLDPDLTQWTAPQEAHCLLNNDQFAATQIHESASPSAAKASQDLKFRSYSTSAPSINSTAFRSETGRTMPRKRTACPDEVEPQKQYFGSKGQIQGIQLKFRGTFQRASKRVKARVACERCKRQKSKCENFQANPYLPCAACSKMATPKFLVNLCVIDAYLLDIRLFRPGPPQDNPTHPLSFKAGHMDVLASAISDVTMQSDSVELELTHEGIGKILPMTVSRYNPMPGDKLAYEGSGKHGPYRFEMPPYCITDFEVAKCAVFEYIEKTKATYLDRLVDRDDKLLRTAFEYAINYPKSLVQKALSIWTATRLIERTWNLHGSQTLGIDRSIPREDPWNGFVPVTPIMDQQLDQIVIREYLMPRKIYLLDRISRLMASEKERLDYWFEIVLALIVLLNNAETQLKHDCTFSARYGFSGRYGPKGKYQHAEAQIHAGRTLLGHFHHVCRGGAILSNPAKALAHIPLKVEEKRLLKRLQCVVAERRPEYERLRFETRYEANGYFVSQMFDRIWDGGTGYIKED